MKKTLLVFSDEDIIGESQAFFDGDKLITFISLNDAHYRDEYMRCLFKHFGISVKYINKLTKKQYEQIKEYC